MFDSENAIALDTMQGNRPHLAGRGKSHGFSRVAAGTWGIFHLRQKTQSPSHIPISEGRLPLRCLWKVGLPLQSKTGNHSLREMIWVDGTFLKLLY